MGDHFEYSDAFDVPGAPLHRRLRPGAVCCSVRLLLGVEHHDSEALLAVSTTKPLATNESRVACGERDDVLAEVSVDQAMAKIVDEMEEIGYVVRRPDPADRRAKLIILTPRGVGAVKAGEETIVGIEQELIDRLGDADYRSLQRILAKLAEVP